MTNQHILSDTKEGWQHFCPLNPFKSNGHELWKGMIKWSRTMIKILDPSCKSFYGQYVTDYPCWFSSHSALLCWTYRVLLNVPGLPTATLQPTSQRSGPRELWVVGERGASINFTWKQCTLVLITELSSSVMMSSPSPTNGAQDLNEKLPMYWRCSISWVIKSKWTEVGSPTYS